MEFKCHAEATMKACQVDSEALEVWFEKAKSSRCYLETMWTQSRKATETMAGADPESGAKAFVIGMVANLDGDFRRKFLSK